MRKIADCSETYENINNVSFCEINDDRFLFVTVQKNWHESEEFCNLIDRSLVQILGEQMNANIIKILRQIGSNEDYWIRGIYRDDSWYWIENSRPTDNITWAAWATGEPNNAGIQNCMQMWRSRD